MSETPPEEPDFGRDDPVEPRINEADSPDVDEDADETLVSEGDPPSTTQ